MFFATANTPKPWLLQLWSFLYPRAWRCIALSLGTEILIMVLWAESSLHGFPKPPMFHLVSQNSNLQSCLCYSATLHCVFTQKLWELHFTSLIWVPIMATETLWMSQCHFWPVHTCKRRNLYGSTWAKPTTELDAAVYISVYSMTVLAQKK